jgi:predicted transcriptional regulator
MELSVTEYAKSLGVTRQAILLQIKEKRLPKNVTVKKIGNTYSLSVRGQKNKKKSFEMLHNGSQINTVRYEKQNITNNVQVK